mmetsp:Transcript_2880/g.7357  ORF Transcript_2880/g.7357 Transcript_2880/m.7357 type:complete len:226 (-) Transcript_2880:393-1070(-)
MIEARRPRQGISPRSCTTWRQRPTRSQAKNVALKLLCCCPRRVRPRWPTSSKRANAVSQRSSFSQELVAALMEMASGRTLSFRTSFLNRCSAPFQCNPFSHALIAAPISTTSGAAEEEAATSSKNDANIHCNPFSQALTAALYTMRSVWIARRDISPKRNTATCQRLPFSHALIIALYVIKSGIRFASCISQKICNAHCHSWHRSQALINALKVITSGQRHLRRM